MDERVRLSHSDQTAALKTLPSATSFRLETFLVKRDPWSLDKYSNLRATIEIEIPPKWYTGTVGDLLGEIERQVDAAKKLLLDTVIVWEEDK